MIDKLKDRIYAAFAISLVASYFACLGYFAYFKLDISSYLSVEDLIMVFAKWIWFTGFFAFFVLYNISNFFKKTPNKESWWGKTIKGSLIKRRFFIIVPFLIGFSILFILYEKVRTVTIAIFAIGFVLIIITLLLRLVSRKILDKKEVSELNFEDWIFIIMSSAFLIIGVPFIGGTILAINLPKDNIIVTLEDNKVLKTKDSSNTIYLGKTHDNFFLYNSISKTTTVYRMERVKSLEEIESLIKFK